MLRMTESNLRFRFGEAVTCLGERSGVCVLSCQRFGERLFFVDIGARIS